MRMPARPFLLVFLGVAACAAEAPDAAFPGIATLGYEWPRLRIEL